MTATPKPDAHSSVVGGSSAEKRIACPASWQMEQKLPAQADTSSAAADEGTACHEAMAYILTNDITELDVVRGMTFGISDTSPDGYVMTDELMETCIYPCMDFFDALDAESDAEGGLQFLVENQCEMPGIPGAFGTSDLICRTDKRSVIADWKFGVGVLVRAFYEELSTSDPDIVILRPNAQLMFYARAAMFTFPHMFETDPDWPVDLYIVQPRAKDGDPDAPFSKFTTTVRELEAFRIQLIAKVAEAMGSSPTLKRGAHCKFAKCKAICPAFTGAAIDLTKMASAVKAKKQGKPLEGIDINWSTVYSDLLDLADASEAWVSEVRAQAHSFLEDGHIICDTDGNKTWKLVDKRPSLKYTDESGMVKLAMKHGLTTEEIMTKPETKTPAALRDAIATKLPGKTQKARGEAAKELIKPFTANVSSGTTLAPADDKRREFVSIAANVAKLSTKLAALTGR